MRCKGEGVHKIQLLGYTAAASKEIKINCVYSGYKMIDVWHAEENEKCEVYVYTDKKKLSVINNEYFSIIFRYLTSLKFADS